MWALFIGDFGPNQIPSGLEEEDKPRSKLQSTGEEAYDEVVESK